MDLENVASGEINYPQNSVFEDGDTVIALNNKKQMWLSIDKLLNQKRQYPDLLLTNKSIK